MALISFFGAKGAPGVTSTAALVAALWPRPTLLVDADADGGDLALRLTTPTGAALTRNPGLLTLLPLARRGLAPAVVMDHTQVAMGGQRVLVGLEHPQQAEASGALWPVLARALRELPGTDVVIDAGQLHRGSRHHALVQESDLVIGVVRAEPSSVVHMRTRIAGLVESFAPLGAEAPRVGLVCLETVHDRTEASSAVQTITQEVSNVLDLGHVALDRRAVRMFHGDPVARPERSLLVRSGRELVQRMLAAAGPTLAAPAAAPGEHAGTGTDTDEAPTSAEEDEPQDERRPRTRGRSMRRRQSR